MKSHLTSYGSGPDDGVASPLPFGGYPLPHLLKLNSVARSAARGVGRHKSKEDKMRQKGAIPMIFTLLALTVVPTAIPLAQSNQVSGNGESQNANNCEQVEELAPVENGSNTTSDGWVKMKSGKRITLPKLLRGAPAQWPSKNKLTTGGQVSIEILISREGGVVHTRLIKTDIADPAFVEAAEEAVAQWIYKPAHNEDGNPVCILWPVVVSFTIK